MASPSLGSRCIAVRRAPLISHRVIRVVLSSAFPYWRRHTPWPNRPSTLRYIRRQPRHCSRLPSWTASRQALLVSRYSFGHLRALALKRPMRRGWRPRQARSWHHQTLQESSVRPSCPSERENKKMSPSPPPGKVFRISPFEIDSQGATLFLVALP